MLIDKTPQELLDTFLVQAAKQKRRSRNVFGVYGNVYSVCTYRIEIDGELCMCAIGANIPNSAYDPKIEGVNVTDLYRFGIEFSAPSNFLRDLQNAHDFSKSLAALQHNVTALCEKWELNGALLDNVKEWK